MMGGAEESYVRPIDHKEYTEGRMAGIRVDRWAKRVGRRGAWPPEKGGDQVQEIEK